MHPTVEDEYEALLQFCYLAPIGIVQTRLNGEILMANPLCAQLLMPLSSDGNLDNLFTALAPVAPDLRHRAQAFDASHGMVCEGLQMQVDAGRPGGKGAQVLSLSLLKLDETRLMAVLSDVSLAVKRDRELRLNHAWISTIVAGITDYAVMTLDAAGHATNWNPGIARLTGFAADAVVGQPYALFYPDDAMPGQRVLDRLHEADRSGWSLDEGWRRRADGSRFWGSCLIAPLLADDEAPPEERAYSLIVRDISDRREANETLRSVTSCDHLTGLVNRRAFFEAAELEVQRWQRQPRPLSIVMVDADHFKRVNDTHGHAAGGAVLRHLAAGLSATFRTMDVVARIGGEEFVVLLPDTTLDGACGVAARLCQRIAEHAVEVDGQSIRYTVSAGVATMDASVDGVAELLKRADTAMYAAKAQGRNRVERWRAELAAPVPAAAA
jgi:diguanylate cyclase (GGDEF)-like protein/PAS domain S-box-containing protein